MPAPRLPRSSLLHVYPRKTLSVVSRNLHDDHHLHQLFRILFFGRDQFSCLVLQELHAARDVWEKISVVTYPDRKTGRRGAVISVSPLKLTGQSLELPIHTIPLKKSEFKFWKPPLPFAQLPSGLDSENISPPPNHLLISASFGRIFSSSVLQLFAPERCLNVHPSLLPSYRGAAPIQHALMRGEKETGVCVIEMMERKKGIDAGRVFASERVSVPDDAMFASLRDNLAQKGGKLLVSVLRDILAGKARLTPQHHEPSAPRAPPINPADALLDFTIMSAEDIVRRYRALSHQRPLTVYLPARKTALQLHSPSIFHSATSFIPTMAGSAIYHVPSRAILVRCADDSVLSIPKVKQENRALLDAKEWWNGMRSMGLVDGGEIRLTRIPDEC